MSIKTYYNDEVPNKNQLMQEDLVINLKHRIVYAKNLKQEIIKIIDWGEITPIGEWCAKYGPIEWVVKNVNNWAGGKGEGESFNWISSADRINILKDGMYEVTYRQRSDGSVTNPYGTVSINGLRSNAENQVNGVFYHDHASIIHTSTVSTDVGLLKKGY